ncbi:unnamed protein product [Lymnaea stagnalis]|uniref:Uncharacterized protein n=1 Tax=Lymnaea stagnalis TaxID=6523 RepID=A0AAV2IS89_LYMST
MTMANATMTSPPTNGVSSRKTNKPLMEKRRRARINDSLSQLKSLVIQSSKKDSSQFNKLEKADILELTVKYLRNLQNQQHLQQQSAVASSDISLAGKYQAGFMECANEVIRYLGQSQGFTDDIKSRVVGHLASCVQLASKSSFSKPQNNVNPSGQTNAAIAVPAQQQTTAAQLPNGQIIQIVNGSYHQMKQYTPAAASAPVQITSSPANLSTSPVSHVAVSAAPSPVSASSPFSRYTQPLHIQIPPVLSPVLIQSKLPQQQKMSQPQQLSRLQETAPQSISHLPAPQQEKVISSSSSPHLRDRSMSPVPMRLPKHLSYYTHEDDYIPRSRTYSMTSSSSDSELISPLNLSQSPQYYDSRKENNYPSKYPASHQEYHQQVPLSANDRVSPGHYILSDKSVFSSHYPSKFASVIVDGRKHIDGSTLKYMSMVMEDERHCIRHEESTSPASSVGEDRLWRPW